MADRVFAKVGHAMNKNGDGEKYKEVDVAQTLNTFQNNSEARAIELVCVEITDLEEEKKDDGHRPLYSNHK